MVKNWKDLNNKEKAEFYRQQREFCKDEIDDVDIIKALKQCEFIEDGDGFIISGFNKNLSKILSVKD
jgi:hypothetical protein